ncbi:hypothetical protein E3Q22_01849 [Wallemia mellicola]|uniref:Glucosamine 6-phosphate N-acetyltransferase n=1 Tax=Wallemia mellicola TaxID=1708541 RepID=A0A4T0TCZ7_9BASI|nr:hypothetical protein E3Q22_01849 [Wallemia mellicola]TIC14312.1 hypothetical protein E3Q15_01781 [Wallemia mellicola]TIC24787.1 hypothetical protein E3Q12_01321 [Wallemia mellicola]TIC56922.1 hypothetical protein E3Q05_01491 [Wallemia mellicola]TIC61971.1 hypothetical protein E3Q03_02505 [Wallemia mellicola]
MTIVIKSEFGDKNELYEKVLWYAVQKTSTNEFQCLPKSRDLRTNWMSKENEPTAEHIVIFVENKPAGTIRLVEKSGKGKLTRLAVLKEYRNLKLGGHLIKALIDKAKERGYKEILCHSQIPVVGLYQKYGFEVFGDEFDEDGAPHLPLVLKV